jgi:hypothetical protein
MRLCDVWDSGCDADVDGVEKTCLKKMGGISRTKKVAGDLVQLPAADHCTMADAFSSNGLVLIASEKR